MTPKEKAEELFDKFNKKGLYQISDIITRTVRKELIKQCALIAVDEIIKSIDELFGTTKEVSYYKQVKQEIEKL